MLTGAGDRAFCAGGDLKSALDGRAVVALDPAERAAHARGERPGVLGPDALDRPPQADDRRGQRRRLRGRAGVGLLDRPGDRRRARDLRRHLPALEHRAGRRRHAAPAAHRRLPARDGADHHRPGDRRRRGARIGLVNEVVPSGTCVERALELAQRDRRPPPARDPHRPRGGRARLRPAARRGPAHRGRVLRPLLDTPEIVEGLRAFNERDHPDRVRGGVPGRALRGVRAPYPVLVARFRGPRTDLGRYGT